MRAGTDDGPDNGPDRCGKLRTTVKDADDADPPGDHAAARDAVFKNVGQELLDRLGLFTIETRCSSKDEFLTRPDLGRVFPEEKP